MRFCTQCETDKPDEDFSKTARWCKTCRNDYSRKYYAENKEKVRAYQNGWRDTNGDLHRGYNAKYRAENREKAAASTKKWHEKNPVRRFAAQSIGFKKRAGHIVTLTVDDVLRMWEEQKGLCALSGLPMKSNLGIRGGKSDSPSLDRVAPFLGYHVGNVRLLCYGVNAGRGTLSDEEFVAVCRAVVARADAKNQAVISDFVNARG